MKYRQKDMCISEVVTKNSFRKCLFMPSKPKMKYTIQTVLTGYTAKSTGVQSGNLTGNCSCEIELLSSCYQT